MRSDDLRIVEPCEAMEAAFIDMLDDFRAAGEPFHGNEQEPARADFAGFVRELRAYAQGEGLEEGLVSWDTYWLVAGARMVGAARLRHGLTPGLEKRGGHIGYDIRPSERGKGYATRLLAMVLEKARERGMERALVTCQPHNKASARVIEKNGGRLADVVTDEESGTLNARYWIDL